MPLYLYPFRYRDPLSGKWVRARYVAEREVIANRYDEWEVTGPAEIRDDGPSGYFSPFPPRVGVPPNVDAAPVLRADERDFVLLFLRRYVTWCARSRRYAAMQGAARLYREVGAAPAS